MFVLFARTGERKREDILFSPLIKERETIEIRAREEKTFTSSCF